MRGVIFVLDSKFIKDEYLNRTYSELVGIIGIDAVLKIHSAYKGQQIFFPMDLFSKEFIRQQIAEEYNGHNIRQLAVKYGYTEKWIRRILRDNIVRQSSTEKTEE
ncbi:MAG: Mor transcription activator family protein [Clostridia bacterium]|nr:Mor transcription activator family protein [Clostridia bacterium]